MRQLGTQPDFKPGIGLVWGEFLLSPLTKQLVKGVRRSSYLIKILLFVRGESSYLIKLFLLFVFIRSVAFDLSSIPKESPSLLVLVLLRSQRNL